MIMESNYLGVFAAFLALSACSSRDACKVEGGEQTDGFFVEAVLLEWRSSQRARLPTTLVTLSSESFRSNVMKALAEAPTALHAKRARTRDRESFTLKSLSSRSYVKDFDVEGSGATWTVTSARLGTITTGFVVRIVPERSGKDGEVSVTVQAQFLTESEPPKRFETRIASEPVIFCVPKPQKSRWSSGAILTSEKPAFVVRNLHVRESPSEGADSLAHYELWCRVTPVSRAESERGTLFYIEEPEALFGSGKQRR